MFGCFVENKRMVAVVACRYKRLAKRTINTYSAEEMRAILGASASVVQASNPSAQVGEEASEDSRTETGRKRRLEVVEETTTTEEEEETAVVDVTEQKRSKKRKTKKLQKDK